MAEARARINVVCRNWEHDRVLPRFAHYLATGLGWTLTSRPAAGYDAHYLMGYFECQMFERWPPSSPTAALFTHREERPPKGSKARLFDQVARQVQLRTAMCRLYADDLARIGPTVQPPLPVERDRFTPVPRRRGRRPRVGLAGYVYATGRKGEELVSRALRAGPAGVEWAASGRGWPVRTTHYDWAAMPRFYQSLDVFACLSLVEGGPMTVLEALSCGVPVVIPRRVGILDELPEIPGIHRYERGNAKEFVSALEAALALPCSPENLRAVTEPYTIEAWCRAHADAFDSLLASTEPR